MKNFILILLLMFTTNKYETQKYDTILSEDDFEIRFYHTSLKAKVVSNGGANSNFYKLFRFISGNNTNGEKIAMTTPVYMKSEEESSTMEFVMPANYDLQTISKPLDESISIFESEAKYYACIRYGGYSNPNKFEAHSKKLIKKLSDYDITSRGDIFYVSYNSPYKLFNRRNEVMIEIDYKN
tara:strand:+ start:3603 stop:4148 length:546 start_codon:yes stop_codon:yes gene_type:complete